MNSPGIVRELEQALRGRVKVRSEDGALTTEELMRSTGRSAVWVRTALREAIQAGAWETLRVRRKDITGVMHSIPAYRPVAVPKKAAKSVIKKAPGRAGRAGRVRRTKPK